MARTDDSKSCARCGGETASGTLKLGREDASVVIAGKPDGFLGVVPYTTSKVAARVCVKCGAIELYALDVRDLLRIDDD